MDAGKISTKIKITVPLKSSELDTYKFMSTVAFFLSDVLEKYIGLFSLATVMECYDPDDRQGCCFVSHNDQIHFVFYPDEIFAVSAANMGYKNLRKSIFLVLLHEIGHGVCILERYSHVEDQISLEQFYDQGNVEIEKIQKSHSDLNKWELSRIIPDEILADRFAFCNLAYFENLYDFEGPLV